MREKSYAALTAVVMPVGDAQILRERRAQLEHERQEALVRREEALREQNSPANSAEVRIRMWELRHGLALPISTSHKLIGVIARATSLSVDAIAQVQSERRERSALSKPAQPSV